MTDDGRVWRAIGLLLCVVGGCGGADERRPLGDRFPAGVGIDLKIGFELRMSEFDMAPDDIACMSDLAMEELPTPNVHWQLVWTRIQLNDFAARCQIDFSELSTSYD